MPKTSFRAMVVEETDSMAFVRCIKKREISDLPKGEVLIKVQYSSLNYKDALGARRAIGRESVTVTTPNGLDDLNEQIEKILSGDQMGRRVVDLNR